MKIRKIFAVLICIMLFVPVIGMLAGKSDDPNNFLATENRNQTKFIYTSPKKLPENTEKWFNDNYGFRKTLILQYNIIMRKVFSTNDQSKCIIGKDNYLFLGNSFDKVISGFTNTLYETPEELEFISKVYKDNREKALKQKAFFYAFIAPNKHSIYSEMLPYFIQKNKGFDLYKYALNTFAANEIKTIDMKKLFLSKYSKDHNVLYHKTDTHWSALGAYYAYYEVMKLIRNDFPHIRIIDKPNFAKVPNNYGYDLVNICGLTGQNQNDFAMLTNIDLSKVIDLKTQKAFAKVTTGLDAAENPYALNAQTVLVLRDSFGISMFPYFAQTFKKVIYIHQSKLFDKQIGYTAMLKKYNPDIVIDERVERGLNTLSQMY